MPRTRWPACSPKPPVRAANGHAGSSWSGRTAADLAHSETLAQEDIRLARQAEAEIQEASRTLRKGRAYFSMGVTLNIMGAEGQIGEAERLYQSQNYEQAIRTAAAAIQQIREAHAVAVQQAFWRQMQVDASQRQAAAATTGPRVSFGGAASVSSPPAAPARTPAPQGATAEGAWTSETAEGQW